MYSYEEINELTGFAQGERFSTAAQVRWYFDVENMMATFPHAPEDSILRDQDELDKMAALVIKNRWHCAVYWDTLRLRPVDGIGVLSVDNVAFDKRGSSRYLALLQEFRTTGGMLDYFFERIDFPHEEEEDPSTWGPQSPDEVVWDGFGDYIYTVGDPFAGSLDIAGMSLEEAVEEAYRRIPKDERPRYVYWYDADGFLNKIPVPGGKCCPV